MLVGGRETGGCGGAAPCRGCVRTDRWVTDVRTHRLHLRGGGGLGQVDSGNTLMAVVHVPDTLPDLSETDRVSREGFAQGKLSALELDPAVLLDPSHLELGVVLDRRQAGGERAETRGTARRG